MDVNCIVSTGAHRERVQYGFDRNSRRTWRRRVEVGAAGRMTKMPLALQADVGNR